MLLDEFGILNIDEAVLNSDSYQKIMEDGIVIDEELEEQSKKVTDLLKDASCLSEEQQAFIEKLLVESCVLSAISQIYAKQLENK